MGAIVTDRLLSPRRVSRRHPIDLSETFKRVWDVAREGLLLIWMLTVVSFSLIIAAGAVGLLG